MANAYKDEFIMDTNNSSIVSKRSVEKLYYANEPHYFRYFVNKLKRRAPVINRGYWLRMKAVEHTVEQFLAEPTTKQKVVINLGCGYDPLPWLMLGKQQGICQAAKFVDVDYPPLMIKKMEVLRDQQPLLDLFPDLSITSAKSGVLCDSTQYAAVGCDLHDLDFLSFVLKEHLHLDTCSIAILFVAEVSTAYMELEASQAVFRWSAGFDDVRFCLLEQHVPAGKDHPFAQTMLKHFQKLRTPLHAIGTLAEMRARFVYANWPQDGIDIRSLWRLWSDPTFLTAQQRRKLDFVEPFDEWEEYALFASHYFLLVARKGCSMPDLLSPEDYMPSDLTIGESVSCEESTMPSTQRRFATVIPSEPGVMGLHGGLGKNGRLADMDTFVVGEAKGALTPPQLREGLMCHTVTALHSTQDCLLVGGRASPDRAFADCWLRTAGVWRKTHSLPRGRYRHCATGYIDTEGHSRILIFGGKADASNICTNILAWRKDRGWSAMKAAGSVPKARFGAAIILDINSSSTGLLLGGIAEDGTICREIYRWSVEAEDTICFKDVTNDFNTRFAALRHALPRFGAQLVHWQHGAETKILLIGGVAHNDLLTRDNNVLDLTSFCAHPLTGVQPLLVGFNLQDRTCVGGGATCFSFGTFWNASYTFQFASEEVHAPAWRLQAREQPPLPENDGILATTRYDDTSAKRSVPVIVLRDAEHFDQILQDGKPVVIKDCNLGQCVSRWTPEYLKTSIGPRKVVVHAAESKTMDFRAKNFRYETKDFDRFIDAIEDGDLLYLRTLSVKAPSEAPTDIAKDFPEIAGDFQLPAELQYVKDHAHSTPLRISGSTIMWLHYDVMANILCQIRGSKTLLLFPPQDVTHFGIDPGMSSSSVDVFGKGAPKHCHPYEAKLMPGDILFIPSLWLHSAAPTGGISVAANVFFRHLDDGYAAGRDVYGNRDFAAYERGRRDIAKIAKSFATLPVDISQAYIERLILELRSLASSG